MTDQTRFHIRHRISFLAVTLLLLGPVSAWGQSAESAARFAAPEEALKALLDAAKTKDPAALAKVFGPEVKELLSGDAVQTAAELERFARSLETSAKFEPAGEDQFTLAIGADGHPFAIPLVKEGDKWFFDTEEGKEEILNRRIGENELRAMSVCRGYVAAQREYFAQDRDADHVLEYAQRLGSTSGQQDGLYWDTKDGEPPSPLGPLVAQARGEGYGHGEKKEGEGPSPYFGYIFKALTRQGADAPGGKMDYVINGNMIAGFALLAYPVDWGNSGIMTFMVGPNGVVLEKNLGEGTLELVKDVAEFNPDSTWKPVEG
jgi:hypothetical protein